MDHEPNERRLRTYGRIHGRTLRSGRASLVEERLPALRVDLAQPVPASWTGPVWLELGFGGGEHLAAQAKARPDLLLLGAEPFVNGVASTVRHIVDERVDNARIHPGDGRELMAALPSRSIDRVFILFPDPWPKARHHKRRLVNDETVAELARIMKPGATLRFATDWADYIGWTLQRFAACPAFAWTAERAADWREAPQDHVPTRYELKRLGDCAPAFLEFLRL